MSQQDEAGMRGTMRQAIAVALYDTLNTARLSEHPEDEVEYGRLADGFKHWLEIHGFTIQAADAEGEGE